MTAGAIAASAPTYSASPYGGGQAANGSTSGVTNAGSLSFAAGQPAAGSQPAQNGNGTQSQGLSTDSYRRNESPMAAPLLSQETMVPRLPSTSSMSQVATKSNAALWYVGSFAVAIALAAGALPALTVALKVPQRRVAENAATAQAQALEQMKSDTEQIPELTANLVDRSLNDAAGHLRNHPVWNALVQKHGSELKDLSKTPADALHVFQARVLAAEALDTAAAKSPLSDLQQAQTLQRVTQVPLDLLTGSHKDILNAGVHSNDARWSDAHKEWKLWQSGIHGHADDAITLHNEYLKTGPDRVISHMLKVSGGRI
jgi:hypothetical protein